MSLDVTTVTTLFVGIAVIGAFVVQAIHAWRDKKWKVDIKEARSEIDVDLNDVDLEISQLRDKINEIKESTIKTDGKFYSISTKLASIESRFNSMLEEIAHRKDSDQLQMRELIKDVGNADHKGDINKQRISHLEEKIIKIEINIEKLTDVIIKLVQDDK